MQSSTTSAFGTLADHLSPVGHAYAPLKAYVGGHVVLLAVVVLNSDGDVVATSATRSFTVQTAPAALSAGMTATGTFVTMTYSGNVNGGAPITGFSVRYREFGTATWT